MSNIIDTDAKIIVADQFGFGQPALCRCSDTLMFAAHINDSSQLEIHKSINNGSSWTLVKTFTEVDPGDFEMCAIDSTSAAISFVYDTDSIKLYVTVDSGSTWIQKLVNTNAATKVNIAYDPLENRLWQCYFYLITSIYIRYSDDKGDNWTYKTYSPGVGDKEVVDIGINPTNSKVYVVLAETGLTLGYRYIFSKIGDYESVGSGLNRGLYDSCIIVDSAGDDWVITEYNSVSDGKYRIGWSKNGAILSFSNILLGPGAIWTRIIVPGSLSCGVDGEGNIFAFYTKVSDEKTYYRKYNGSIWETEIAMITIANDRISTEKRPIAGSNKLHYVYYKAP